MKYHNTFKYVGGAFLGVLLLSGCMDSIDTDNPAIPYPAIGGYENSDDVASANLITKLSFENNLADQKNAVSGAVGTKVAYTAGIKGMAFNGSSTESRYAVGEGSSAIMGLKSFTVAFWMKSNNSVDPNPPGIGKGAQGIFSVVRPTEFWGGLNVFIENPDSSKPDRIRLKLSVENGRTGVNWKGQGVIANLDGYKGKWVHMTFVYNAKESRCYVYQDGEPAKNLDGFAYSPAGGALSGYASWFADDPGGIDNPKSTAGYGDLEMVGTNGKLVFGSHPFETDPPLNNGSQQDWATSFAGQLDEFRLYNAALTAPDVIALYKLEKDGR